MENRYVSKIDRMFQYSLTKKWYETYWAFDIHGTILIPTHRKDCKTFEMYPLAKPLLQHLTERKDIKLILFSSSYPDEIEFYISEFKKLDIVFDYVNENPEISTAKGSFGYYKNKFYFNLLFDDKAGFIPEEDLKPIYLRMLYHWNAIKPDPKWSMKF